METRMVYGVGINDADYFVNATRGDGTRWRCPFYKAWKNMLARCYSKAYWKQQPERRGSKVDERWHSFMAFREWMVEQDWKGNHLDKDLLVPGNKNYSPETCVFVSRQVNSYVCVPYGVDGIKGVYQTHTGSWKAVANMLDGSGQKAYYFKTKEEAVNKYSEIRLIAIDNLAAAQTNPIIKDAILKLK